MDFTEFCKALALTAAYLDAQAMERICFSSEPQAFNNDEHSMAAFYAFCVEAWGEQGIAQGIMARGDLTYVRQLQ